MPKRLVHASWYVKHRNLVGYLILTAGVVFALAGVARTAHDTSQAAKREAVARARALAYASCVSGKETRAPLLRYLKSQIALSDEARQAGLLPPSPPALRHLQNKSLRNLRTLTRVLNEKQKQPCPPGP